MARYLVAAELDEDSERGYALTQAAKRLAARVGVVREACGIASYRTGRWAEALAELRAARRMTGRDEYLPIMADCERALGRLDRALALVREAKAESLNRAMQIELHIVESGIRRDEGLNDAAVLVLQVPELTSGRQRPWSARLFYAYADALLAAGRVDEARDSFAQAAAADTRGETDAADRLNELDGIEFEDLAELEDLADVEDLIDLDDLTDAGAPGDDDLADDDTYDLADAEGLRHVDGSSGGKGSDDEPNDDEDLADEASDLAEPVEAVSIAEADDPPQLPEASGLLDPEEATPSGP